MVMVGKGTGIYSKYGTNNYTEKPTLSISFLNVANTSLLFVSVDWNSTNFSVYKES